MKQNKISFTQIRRKLTPDDIKKIKKMKEYDDAALYLGGIYSLLSIICLWMDEAEDNLKAMGLLGFGFKQDFMACLKTLNRFEVTLRDSVENWESINKGFSELEPMLRQFIFGTETPELKAKKICKDISDYLNKHRD